MVSSWNNAVMWKINNACSAMLIKNLKIFTPSDNQDLFFTATVDHI